MNRYKIKYMRGYGDDLPQEVVADFYRRSGPNTDFIRGHAVYEQVTLHSLATKVIVHIALVEEDVDE
ncbi:hypothetical protein [Serinicoccus marinus]|uniref:hypothetical protein n=1 Tax=Serinicoccus marinus TaxID=247333 RepID=UPI0003B385C2|nr:hypothetical protein [Serinicoccus marinus]